MKTSFAIERGYRLLAIETWQDGIFWGLKGRCFSLGLDSVASGQVRSGQVEMDWSIYKKGEMIFF